MAPALWRLPERARRAIWRRSGYEPGPEQLAAHLDPARFKLVAGGERAGKSRFSAEELLCWLTVSGPGSPYWIVGPDYEQARAEFIHLREGLERTGLLAGTPSMPKNGQWSLKTQLGAEVVTKSSVEVLALASIAPRGVLMVEAAQQPYEVYLRLRGRVSEHRGPLVMSGTFEGSLGWYPEHWQRWQAANPEGGRSFSLPTWSNRAIFPGGRRDPEILALEAAYPEDLFMERLGAVPCPPATLVFREFSHAEHVRPCPFRPERPVQLWVDPGYAGAYAVLAVQIEHGVVEVIDEVYGRGLVAQEVIARCQAKPWWAKVRYAVIDVAGLQHQGMESHAELWQRVAGVTVHAQRVGIADGILRHRTFLRDPASGQPRLYHDPRCKSTIAEYGLYKYPDIKENRPEREEPIDRDNHAMKAIAYGLVANFGLVAPARRRRVTARMRRG